MKRKYPIQIHKSYVAKIDQVMAEQGLGIDQACEQIGYSRSQYYKYRNLDKAPKANNVSGPKAELAPVPETVAQARPEPSTPPLEAKFEDSEKISAVILTGSKQQLSEILRNILA